jgi:hypothetical protein
VKHLYVPYSVCHSKAAGLLGNYDSIENAEWTARLRAIAAGEPTNAASFSRGSPAMVTSSCPAAPTHMHLAAPATGKRGEQQQQAYEQQLSAASVHSAADVVTSTHSRSRSSGSELDDRSGSLFALAAAPSQSRHHSRTRSASRRNPAIRALALESALAEQKATFRREALRNLWLREKSRFQELVRGGESALF